MFGTGPYPGPMTTKGHLASAALILAILAPAPTAPAEGERAVHVVPDAEPLTAVQCEANGFRPQDSAGLFVGIRRFLDSEGKEHAIEVPFAADDAVDLAHLFIFELKLLTPQKAVLLLSGEPQKDISKERLGLLERAGVRRGDARFTTILEQVARLRKASGEGGLLILTFATHGYTSSGTQLLLGQDSVLEFLEQTGLPVEKILDLASTSAPRQLVLIDACRERVNPRRSVGADPKASGSAGLEKALGQVRGMAVLCAAAAGGYSYDDRKTRNGVFTAAVLDGLRGAARHDERGYITPSTLGDFVDARVKEWVRENVAGDGKVRGISYAVDDLRSGTMPLAWKRRQAQSEAESAKRLLAILEATRSEHLTRSMVAEITWAAGNIRAPAIEPLTARLEKLERFGPEYAHTLSTWWRDEGRRRFAPIGVDIRTACGRTEFAVGEKFELALKSDVSCFLTVIAIDSEGRGEILFPNPDRPGSEVGSGFEDRQPVLARPPGGKSRCIAIATRGPLEIDGVGAADFLRGFVALPRGMETRAALGGARKESRLPLSKLIEALSPSEGTVREIAITTLEGGKR